MCDQMSEEQFALPTFLPRTTIVGVRNIYEFPNSLLELQDTFKRSLQIPEANSEETELSKMFSIIL